jgi:hypothetical protein
LRIFRHGLSGMLPPGEGVEADNGYVGYCPAKCKVPDSVTTRRDQRKMRGRLECDMKQSTRG